MTSSVNEVTLSLDLTFIRQWLLHQCLIQTIVMEKLNLVRCSLGQLLSRFRRQSLHEYFLPQPIALLSGLALKQSLHVAGSRNLMRLARNQIGLVLLLL